MEKEKKNPKNESNENGTPLVSDEAESGKNLEAEDPIQIGGGNEVDHDPTEPDSAFARLGFFGWSLFVFAVLLDSVSMYFQNYDSAHFFLNLESIMLGARPAEIYWVILAIGVLSLLIWARLAMASLRKASDGPRLFAALLGLPAVFAGFKVLEYAIFKAMESPGIFEIGGERISICLAASLLAALALSSFISTSAASGPDIKAAKRMARLVKIFFFSIFAGGLFLVLKNAGLVLLAAPVVGYGLRAAFNLWVFLRVIRWLGRRAEAGAAIRRPSPPSPAAAFFTGIPALCLTALCFLVPGPTQHLDAVEPPAAVIDGLPVVPSRFEERDGAMVLSSTRLSVVVHEDPFSFAVKDERNRVLFRTYDEADAGPHYRGLALNHEYRAFREIPFSREGELLKSRVRVGSSPFLKADDMRLSANRLVATGKIGIQPVVVNFSFPDEDVLKVTAEAGGGSPFRSYNSSMAFYMGREEKIFGLGGGLSAPLEKGKRYDLTLEPPGGGPPESPGLLSKWSGGRAEVFLGKGTGRLIVPFLYFSRGVGLFIGEGKDPAVELALEKQDAFRVAGEGPLTLYIVSGQGAEEVSARFARLAPSRPETPAFALDPWARVAGDSGEKVRRLADSPSLAEAGVKGVIVTRVEEDGRMPIIGDLAPDLIEAAAEASGAGLKLFFEDGLWIGREDDDYEAAARSGFLAANRTGLPYHAIGRSGFICLLDLTNPKARGWIAQRWRSTRPDKRESKGPAPGFIGAVLDRTALPPPSSVFHNGKSGLAMRDSYTALYAEAVRSVLGDDAVLITGAGYSGVERFVNLAAGEDSIRTSRAFDWKMNMTMAGSPFLLGPYSSADLVGSCLLPPGFEKWEEESAPRLELQKWTGLRSRLFPYLFTLAKRAGEKGTPAAVNPAAKWPGENAWDRYRGHYMLGESLLAVEPGLVKTDVVPFRRAVNFPPGRWMKLDSLEIFEGGYRDVEYRDKKSPLLFLHEGRLLPVHEEDGRPAAETGTDTRTSSDITVHWIYGQPGSLELFDGAQISARVAGESILFRVESGDARQYSWKAFDCPPPLAVYAGGARLDGTMYSYQERARVLKIYGSPGPPVDLEVVSSLAE